MIVYKTTNLVNGKIYIGRDVRNRPSYLGSGKVFLRAIKKYGKNEFRKETLDHCPSLSILNEREKYWITFFNSTNKNIGYNIMEGGQGGNNHNYKKGPEHPYYGKHRPPHIGIAVSKANRKREKHFGKNNKSYKSIDQQVKNLILSLSEKMGRDKIFQTITQMGLQCPARRTITRRLKEWTQV